MRNINHSLGSEVIVKNSILTKREKQVFEMLIINKTTKDIANS